MIHSMYIPRTDKPCKLFMLKKKKSIEGSIFRLMSVPASVGEVDICGSHLLVSS